MEEEVKVEKKSKRNVILMIGVLLMCLLLVALLVFIYNYRTQLLKDPLIFGLQSMSKQNGMNFSCSCDAYQGFEKIGNFQFDNFGYKKQPDLINISNQ